MQHTTDRAAALRLWVVLSRAFAAVQARAQDDVAAHDLTLTEFGILEALHHKGPLLLGELQRKLLVSSGGITYLVDRLVKRGLVERRPCASDRRACHAGLTPEGEALIGRIFPAHAATLERALGGLDAEETERAITLLRKLGRAAADMDDAPSRGGRSSG